MAAETAPGALTERRGNTLIVTINRPEARNAVNAAVSVGGAAAHETLHVGDHPEFDVEGARAAGLRAVWLNRDGHEWPGGLTPPERTISNLRELDELLEATAQPQ